MNLSTDKLQSLLDQHLRKALDDDEDRRLLSGPTNSDDVSEELETISYVKSEWYGSMEPIYEDWSIREVGDHDNHHRYHESLNNVTPADVFCGRQREILTARDIIKRKTMAERRRLNQKKLSMLTSGSLVQV